MAASNLSKELAQQTVDAVTAHGSIAAAARSLGINPKTFASRYQSAKCLGVEPAVQKIFPQAAPPEGYKLKGTSTLYGKDGEQKIQWVKTDASLEKLREMQEAAFQALCKGLRPIKPIKGPKAGEGELATLYTLTDCHVGMLAWSRETGEPWDLDIAERCLVDVFKRMIDAAPASAIGIVNQLGDFLHFDSLSPMTPTNHHILDADSRYQKVVEVAVRILRRVIQMALEKHKTVQVYMHEGNHDPTGSVWLRVMFSQLFEANKRVTVEKSPAPYTAFQHGKTLIGFHHGHLARLQSLPLLFAATFPEQWGGTDYRYIHTGHKHHVDEKEHPGIKVIQHPTLAAPDAYAARGGWLSKRQASSITYHDKLGEVGRSTFVPLVLE